MKKLVLLLGAALLNIATLAAETPEEAARNTLKHAINKYFPVDDIELRLLNRFSIECVLNGLAEMESTIAVSQIGTGRCEAGLFDKDKLFAISRTELHSIYYLFDLLH